jgi:hypothetical protein
MALDAGCSNVFSVETDYTLFSKARDRFIGNYGVNILFGASEEFMPGILASLLDRAVFWLDAHAQENYAHGSHLVPLIQELVIISKGKMPHNHTLMIDDMRCVGKAWGWENITIDMILTGIFAINPNYTVVYEDSKAAPKDILVAFLEDKFL